MITNNLVNFLIQEIEFLGLEKQVSFFLNQKDWKKTLMDESDKENFWRNISEVSSIIADFYR